jgi:hypothetical protein
MGLPSNPIATWNVEPGTWNALAEGQCFFSIVLGHIKILGLREQSGSKRERTDEKVGSPVFVQVHIPAGIREPDAQSVAQSVTPLVYGKTWERDVTPEDVRIFEGTGGEAFAEQLIASGVKYVFGNSASSDAYFYEALVDRPELTYILTPHEGPGAAMATGYIQASGEPAMVMQAAIVGMANTIGQMYNAWKEQTPLVFYSYRADQSTRAGRDGFEEVMYQEEIVGPITKWYWRARRPDMIPETILRASQSGDLSGPRQPNGRGTSLFL